MEYIDTTRRAYYQPKQVEGQFVYGSTQYTVNYSIVEVLSPDGLKCWQYKSATLPVGAWSYDAIVDALVTAEYPASKMQAVINNYLDSPKDADIKAEYTAMQEWRKEAKRIAREAMERNFD